MSSRLMYAALRPACKQRFVYLTRNTGDMGTCKEACVLTSRLILHLIMHIQTLPQCMHSNNCHFPSILSSCHPHSVPYFGQRQRKHNRHGHLDIIGSVQVTCFAPAQSQGCIATSITCREKISDSTASAITLYVIRLNWAFKRTA